MVTCCDGTTDGATDLHSRVIGSQAPSHTRSEVSHPWHLQLDFGKMTRTDTNSSELDGMKCTDTHTHTRTLAPVPHAFTDIHLCLSLALSPPPFQLPSFMPGNVCWVKAKCCPALWQSSAIAIKHQWLWSQEILHNKLDAECMEVFNNSNTWERHCNKIIAGVTLYVYD